MDKLKDMENLRKDYYKLEKNKTSMKIILPRFGLQCILDINQI